MNHLRRAFHSMMLLPPRSRRYTTPLTWCGFALGLAVVLWGASYKMEQYPEQGLAFRVMSPAKLLTEKERPLRQSNLHAVVPADPASATTGHAPAWVVTVRISPAFASARGIALPAPRAGRLIQAQFAYFSFRPPPSPSHS